MQWKLWFVVYNCINWTAPHDSIPLTCGGWVETPRIQASIVFNSQKRCEQVGRDATSNAPFGLLGYRCKPLLDENE